MIATTTALLFSGGLAVAVAQKLMSPEIPVVCPDGQTTHFDVEFYTHDEMGGEPMTQDWPHDIQVKTRDAANGFAASYDWASIDRNEARSDFRESEKELLTQPEAAPRVSDWEAEMSGTLRVFYDDLEVYLASRGLPMETISSVSGYLECGEK
ncbi:hypothetical protein [Tessaracoccus palaemonis]|uniref:Uncharacterized protein n=1 Tax=Tessaracoccus palaemonis TaxID=2829499 RepID=A0ABX8SIZ5_9ACTN|nr:hypothetical protein [Tessaracoccus palaemonis]QXT62635.1 hypothetical protein KDB89_12990 [Tessaracoccus palaemonis]